MNTPKKTIVLLHGHGVDHTIWDRLLPLLSDDYQVVKPNLSLYSYPSIEGYADEIYRLLTNSGIKNATLIGHSMGGYIALAFAEKYPDFIQGFGLFHSTAYADDEAKKEVRNKMAKLLRNKDSAEFIRLTGGNMFSSAFKAKNPQVVQDHIEQFEKLPAEALAKATEAMRDRPDRTGVLSELKVPLLLLAGLDDQLIPFDKQLNLAPFAKTAYTFVLSESGHLGMVEEPEASAKILRWYLENGTE